MYNLIRKGDIMYCEQHLLTIYVNVSHMCVLCQMDVALRL